jgi:hypothetical protein
LERYDDAIEGIINTIDISYIYCYYAVTAINLAFDMIQEMVLLRDQPFLFYFFSRYAYQFMVRLEDKDLYDSKGFIQLISIWCLILLEEVQFPIVCPLFYHMS